MLRPVPSRAGRTSAPAHVLASRPSTALLQIARTYALPPRSINTAHHARLFHQTPARRLLETPDQVMLAVAAGLATGWLVKKIFKLVSEQARNVIATGPPLSWIIQGDGRNTRSVFSVMEAGFSLAKSRPVGLQNDALREFTFHLPREIAGLNKDAPSFRLQDMGSCPDFSDLALHDEFKPSFDQQKETKVFLYYPNDTTKATTAFLVINADLSVPLECQKIAASAQLEMDSELDRSKSELEQQKSLIRHAINSWLATYKIWMETSPSIIKDEIEPGRLPIILCFRENTTGIVFDQETNTFPDANGAYTFFSLVQQVQVEETE